MLYSIIWFEKNNHHRTLINQLVSSIIWFGIFWNTFIQIPTVLRYMLGPFPPFLCHVDIVFRNTFTMQGLLYLDAIIIVRYVFLFHLKNPTALKDGFWRLFLNIWTSGISLTTQIIYAFQEGKNPQNYFLCLGYYPTKLAGQTVKANTSMNYMLLFSFLAHVIAGIRIKLHRRKEHQKDLVQALTVETSPGNKNMMMNFTTNLISLLLLIVSSAGPAVVNKMEPIVLDNYPNYFWVYLIHHYSPQFVLGCTALIYYIKNPPLRKVIWLEMSGKWKNSSYLKTFINIFK
jgi:hypothetical protein